MLVAGALAARPAQGDHASPGTPLPPPIHRPGTLPSPGTPAPPPPPPTPPPSAPGAAPPAPRPASASGTAPLPVPSPAAADAALSALLDRTLTPDQRAERAWLEYLGWRFVPNPSVATITVTPGTPLRRPDLAAAQAAGDLLVSFPPNVDAAEVARFGATLSDLADSIPSRGAWQFLVAPAVERATRKLSENAKSGNFIFPQWLVMNAQIFSMSPPESAWVRRGKICQARGKPSTAIEAFYTEEASAECYVAQTLAAYAIQYELYGPAWFDEVFLPDEIAVGQVSHFHKTPLGKTMQTPPGYPWRALFLRPTDTDENYGVVLARLGPLAFPGLTGILMDQGGASRSNQNFTFVSVSPEAVDALLRRGGFPAVAEGTAELLELYKAARGPFATSTELSAIEAREKEILADPVFSGIRVYIHPYGVVTLAEMADKLRKRDRTAFGLVLYDESREDVFFQRHRRAWKERFAKPPAPR